MLPRCRGFIDAMSAVFCSPPPVRKLFRSDRFDLRPEPFETAELLDVAAAGEARNRAQVMPFDASLQGLGNADGNRPAPAAQDGD
jgi:hypothetical protein